MSKQTAVEWLEDEIKNYWKSGSVMNHELFTGLLNIAKRMEKEQMKEYADYAIKQLHETGICFYDEYGNLEDEKGGEE
jgi:hypothetical protein